MRRTIMIFPQFDNMNVIDRIRQQYDPLVSIEFKDGVWNDDLVSVSYDIDKMINAFTESGIYDKSFIWAKAMTKLLRTGVDYNARCFERVANLARSNDKNINIHNVPEKYWEQAARELGIV